MRHRREVFHVCNRREVLVCAIGGKRDRGSQSITRMMNYAIIRILLSPCDPEDINWCGRKAAAEEVEWMVIIILLISVHPCPCHQRMTFGVRRDIIIIINHTSLPNNGTSTEAVINNEWNDNYLLLLYSHTDELMTLLLQE